MLIDDDYKKEDLDIDEDDEEEKHNKENEIYDKLKNAEEFDNVVKEMGLELSKKIKPLDTNEIINMIQLNEKKKKYYPDDYTFYIIDK